MFSSHEQLVKRSGKKGVDRPEYLKELAEEFCSSVDLDSRRQVLANLANFAYDPINYSWLRKLKIIDIFLDQASQRTSDLCSFAVAGLCNLALDVENKQYILKNGGISVLYECILMDEESVVISAITTLMFLVTPESKPDITSQKVLKQILNRAKSDNPRIQNLAKIFLSDYCSLDQVREAEVSMFSLLKQSRLIHGGNPNSIPKVLTFGKRLSVKVGDVATRRKKITDEDIRKFSELSGDTNPLHLDEKFINSQTTFGKLVVHGAHLNSLVSGVIGTRLPGPGTLVVKQDLYFPNPCYAGEEVEVTVKLATLRKVITVDYTCTTTEGKVVLQGSARLVRSQGGR